LIRCLTLAFHNIILLVFHEPQACGDFSEALPAEHQVVLAHEPVI